MAQWIKNVSYGPDGQWHGTPSLHLTAQEMDLVSLAIESAAGGEHVEFSPSEGIRLYRIKSVLDAAADWMEGEDGED